MVGGHNGSTSGEMAGATPTMMVETVVRLLVTTRLVTPRNHDG